MLEILFKVIVTLAVGFLSLSFLVYLWTHQIDPITSGINFFKNKAKQQTEWLATRDPNAIYQNGNIVGIISGDVKENHDRLIFLEIFNTAGLNRNAPLEYKKERLRIISIETTIGMYSSVSNKGSEIKQNVIKNVTCEKIKK
ncbi:MAG: hypothetical protein WC412_01810 [Candidatus Omnitrophota bacterium]|jgi:hypothetical protein